MFTAIIGSYRWLPPDLCSHILGRKFYILWLSCLPSVSLSNILASTTTYQWRWQITAKLEVKVTQLCLTLCDPLDKAVHGILQAKILEWVAFLFSRGSSQSRDQTQVSCMAGGFFTSWATKEAPKYWSGWKGIFLIQESKRSLLHCRQILDQLSYHRSL